MSSLFLSRKCRILLGGLVACVGYVPLVLDGISGSGSPGNSFVGKCYTDVSEYFSNLMLADETGSFGFDLANGCLNPDLFDRGGELLAEADVVDFESEATGILPDAQKKPQEHAAGVKTVDVAGYPSSKMISGQIRSNFYADARGSGVPAVVVDNVIKGMSKKINFRRSLKIGDHFEILYSNKNELLYARIKTKKKDVEIYRANSGKGDDYCFADGEFTKDVVVAEKSGTFGQPLRGRLVVSDRFGMRRHPITRRIQHHNGVDLRAKSGQPVYAIYDGVVSRSAFYYGYGKCVDLKHPNHYSSRYAHLSNILVRNGQRVKKGQLIGYAGSTGRSTGPHLHLELARYNRVLNPMTVKMMPLSVQKKKKYDSKKLSSFKRTVSRIFSH